MEEFRLRLAVNMEIFPLTVSKKKSDKPEKPELKETKDGSHTLFSHRFSQHYHNPNGAVAESKHNFFEANGLLDVLEKEQRITILEVGFGTGLNLLLLMDALAETNSKAQVHYYTVEAYPIDVETVSEFNFADHLANPELADKLLPIFESLEEGINRFEISDQLEATVYYGFFGDFPLDNLGANFIFHDAFSPNVNEELWTGETFKRLKQLSAPNVVMTTYSSASKAKGAMAWAGWKLAKTRGALGKREMTVAALDTNKLQGLERIDEEHLANRYAQGDF